MKSFIPGWVDRGLDRCEFTGWRVSNGQPATTTSNVKFNNKLVVPLARDAAACNVAKVSTEQPGGVMWKTFGVSNGAQPQH